MATARAGNVIGGGDWSEDRIMPDIVRALSAGQPVNVRNPEAVRPWQHVLEPLSGYLELAEKLLQDEDPAWQSGFNFGPATEDIRSVRELVEETQRYWPGIWQYQSDADAPHESKMLSLTIDKARMQLGWQPQWNFNTSIENTIIWYREVIENRSEPVKLCLNQIHKYVGV